MKYDNDGTVLITYNVNIESIIILGGDRYIMLFPVIPMHVY